MVTSVDVRTVEFSSVRLTQGVDMRSVDEFLDRIVDTLEARERGARPPSGAVSAVDVRQASFPSTWLREGYQQGEVQRLLGEVAETLSRPPAVLVGLDPAALAQRVEAAGRSSPGTSPVRAVDTDGKVFTVVEVSAYGVEVRLHLQAADQS